MPVERQKSIKTGTIINLMTQKNFKETWLPLHHCAQHPDGNAMYEVSNYGKIRKRNATGYKPIKARPNAEGYLVVHLKNQVGMFQAFYVHRLVSVVYKPNPWGYDSVDHIDGDKSNNSIHNLRWVSRSTNISLGHASGAIPKNSFKPHPVKATKGNKEYTFRTASQCAMFIGCSTHAVIAGVKNHYKPGGWQITSLLPPKEINGNLFNDSDF